MNALPSAADAVRPTPQWLAMRIAGSFFVDAAVALGEAFRGDVLQALVLITIMRQNASELPGSALEDDIDRGYNFPRPDVDRQPTTVYAVAKALGLNYETTRRAVHRLVDQGFCKRTERGFLTEVEVFQRSDVSRAVRRLVKSYELLLDRSRRVVA